MGFNIFKELFSKKYVRATIIKDNNQLVQKTIIYDVKNTFILGKCAYVVDTESLRYIRNKPYSFYFENNPYPVFFNSNNFNVGIKSGNLKDILNSKVIQEMVQGKGEATILLILVVVNAILTFIVLAKQFGIIKQ